MRGLVWFRRDLRLHDNPALSAAVEGCDEVALLFVFDEPLLRSGIFGSACVNFILGCLGSWSCHWHVAASGFSGAAGNQSKKRSCRSRVEGRYGLLESRPRARSDRTGLPGSSAIGKARNIRADIQRSCCV